MYFAAQQGCLDVVRFLPSAGSWRRQRLPHKESRAPFLVARQNGHLDVVRWLLEDGDVKDEARNIATAGLYIAAQNGHLDVTGFLREKHGADQDLAPQQ